MREVTARRDEMQHLRDEAVARVANARSQLEQAAEEAIQTVISAPPKERSQRLQIWIDQQFEHYPLATATTTESKQN